MSCLCLNVQSDPYNIIKTIFIFLSYKIKKDIFATVPIRRCKHTAWSTALYVHTEAESLRCSILQTVTAHKTISAEMCYTNG